MANIALIGYGKMGQIIEKTALERGHKIKVIIDPFCDTAEKEINEKTLEGVDVCIDFTHPDVIMDNIKKIAAVGKNIVIGTTGWYDKMDEVKKIAKDNNIGIIWSGNFSIGVNALFRITEYAAKIFNKLEDYDIGVNEIHHTQKADSPSGTASMIGDILIDNLDKKKKIVTESFDRKPNEDELHISSTRVGKVPGVHTIMFDSTADTIELKHTARNRCGFALGSVLAAEFIKERKGFYHIDDMMNEIIK
jgi:4-hydroxy-tetrahydrodipicolinate reductase